MMRALALLSGIVAAFFFSSSFLVVFIRETPKTPLIYVSKDYRVMVETAVDGKKRVAVYSGDKLKKYAVCEIGKADDHCEEPTESVGK